MPRRIDRSGEAETLSERMVSMSEFTSRPTEGAHGGLSASADEPGGVLSLVTFFTRVKKVTRPSSTAAGESLFQITVQSPYRMMFPHYMHRAGL